MMANLKESTGIVFVNFISGKFLFIQYYEKGDC